MNIQVTVIKLLRSLQMFTYAFTAGTYNFMYIHKGFR